MSLDMYSSHTPYTQHTFIKTIFIYSTGFILVLHLQLHLVYIPLLSIIVVDMPSLRKIIMIERSRANNPGTIQCPWLGKNVILTSLPDVKVLYRLIWTVNVGGVTRREGVCIIKIYIERGSKTL